MPNELLAVRIHPWQAFRLRKFAELQGQNEGLILMDALRTFFSLQNLPSELIQQWLAEYRASHNEAPDEVA